MNTVETCELRHYFRIFYKLMLVFFCASSKETVINNTLLLVSQKLSLAFKGHLRELTLHLFSCFLFNNSWNSCINLIWFSTPRGGEIYTTTAVKEKQKQEQHYNFQELFLGDTFVTWININFIVIEKKKITDIVNYTVTIKHNQKCDVELKLLDHNLWPLWLSKMSEWRTC